MSSRITVNDYLKVERNAKCIKYEKIINTPKNKEHLLISHDEVNKYDFSKGFMEVIENEKFVHLYFDFDTINSLDDMISVENWLCKVEEVFGYYTFGGYTNNEQVSEEYGLRYIEGCDHFVSMHVVFYKTAISTEDLMEIMQHTKRNGFTYNVHKLCDHNVYKLGSNSRQIMRHVLSDKIYADGDKNNKFNHGELAYGRPSEQIIQVRGTEKIITRDEWEKIFEKTVPEVAENNNDDNNDNNIVADTAAALTCVTAPVRKCVKKLVAEEIDERATTLDINDKGLIKLDDDEMMELLSYFEPTHDNLSGPVANIYHSPYKKSEVLKYINDWYFSVDHHNIDTVDAYVNKYYEKVNNNKWFYSIIKHLPDSERTMWRNKFIDDYLDDTVEFSPHDNSITLKTLQTKDYKLADGIGIRVNEFMADLKKLFVCINYPVPIYITKQYEATQKSYVNTMINHKEFKDCLSDITLGSYYKLVNGKYTKKTVTAWSVYSSSQVNKNYIKKDGLAFYDDTNDVFNYFTGYKWRQFDEVNINIIKPYLDHIKEVIASDREEIYEYILNWFSYIVQNPAKKTAVALIITGSEGTGKGTFTDVLSNVLGPYANKNLTDISLITGKFNSSLEDKKLIVCNEMSDSDSSGKYFNSDSLKSVITDTSATINAKNMKARERENVVNLIIVSNHCDPVKITNKDRRYLVLETSEKYINDLDHFAALQECFTNEFYEHLYNFFRLRNINNYNPRSIPVTEEKQELINNSKSCYELFYEEHKALFAQGWQNKMCYERYKLYAESNGFKVANVITFGKELKKFVVNKKKKVDGKGVWHYFSK